MPSFKTKSSTPLLLLEIVMHILRVSASVPIYPLTIGDKERRNKMSEAELYAVIGIAVCSGTIGFVIGMKTAWADAKKIYEPYLFKGE